MRSHWPVLLAVAIGSGGGMMVSEGLRIQLGWPGAIGTGCAAGALLAALALLFFRRRRD